MVDFRTLGLVTFSLCSCFVGSAVTYDYVVAGGGTAGLLLAAVLTEDPGITVAVLEAGYDGRQDPRITVPEKEGAIVGTEYDWQLKTVPQLGLYGNKVVNVNKGKVLGGTSAMNYLIWNRASIEEYDAWQNILGNTGWNWTTILAASKASEHFLAPTQNVPLATYNVADHGTAGPVFSTMQRNTFTLYSVYLAPTLKGLKVQMPKDRDNGTTVGAGPVPQAINRDSYTRSYSGSAYTSVQARPNLHVMANAQVARIAWNANSTNDLQVARGVWYRNLTTGGNTKTLISAKEVVLSAGSIQTPQILELSGVGDGSILSPLGISTLIDLPAVGTGLQDKPTYSGSFSFNVNNFTGTEYVQTYLDYAPASRFLSLDDQSTLQQLLASAKASGTMSQSAISMLQHMVVTDQPLIEYGWFLAYVNIYLLHPLSTGTVHINSTYPLATPVINPQYNAATINGTSIDLWLLSKAVSYYSKTVASAPPFSSIEAKFSVSNTLPFSQIQDQVYQGLGIGPTLDGWARACCHAKMVVLSIKTCWSMEQATCVW